VAEALEATGKPLEATASPSKPPHAAESSTPSRYLRLPSQWLIPLLRCLKSYFPVAEALEATANAAESSFPVAEPPSPLSKAFFSGG